MGRAGSEGASVQTPDLQVHLIFPERVFKPRPGVQSVQLTIKPLDPNRIGEPPSEKSYEGNAYRIDATYQPSGEPATIEADTCTVATGQISPCPTLILRYPNLGDSVYVREGSGWERIEAQDSPSELSMIAETNRFGVFVAAGPGAPSRWRNIVLFGLGGVAVIAAVVLARWRAAPRKPARATARKRTK